MFYEDITTYIYFIFLSFSLTYLIFNFVFVLVKYSRELVKNRAISTLFEQVYFKFFAAVNIAIFTIIRLKRYLKKETDDEPVLLLPH